MNGWGDQMAYWLFKSEPDVWGWDDQLAKGEAGEEWDGIRNYQARNNMRAMALGDAGFFLPFPHRARDRRHRRGLREAHRDSTTDDPRWDCVDVKAVRPLERPCRWHGYKADPRLSDMVLVRNSRLSVQPVTEEQWRIICDLGETRP